MPIRIVTGVTDVTHISQLIVAGLIEKSEQGGLMQNTNAYSFLGKYKEFPNQNKIKRKSKK